jgi:hypothetical protein
MVALLTLHALLQGSLACPVAGHPCSPFQGSLARPDCMVALLTLLDLLQGSLARPGCRAALITLPGQPCSSWLHGSLAHPARPLAG